MRNHVECVMGRCKDGRDKIGYSPAPQREDYLKDRRRRQYRIERRLGPGPPENISISYKSKVHLKIKKIG